MTTFNTSSYAVMLLLVLCKSDCCYKTNSVVNLTSEDIPVMKTLSETCNSFAMDA